MPRDSAHITSGGCDHDFLRCDGWMETNVQPICRAGINIFLVAAFIYDCTGRKVTPMQLACELKNCPNAGQIIFKWKTSGKVRYLGISQLKMLQLFVTNIARLDVDTGGAKPVAHCELCFDATADEGSNECLQPHYAIEKHCKNIDECS